MVPVWPRAQRTLPRGREEGLTKDPIMNEEFASPDEVELARSIHCVQNDDEVKIDERTRISRSQDGIWVQGWLFISNESLHISQLGAL